MFRCDDLRDLNYWSVDDGEFHAYLMEGKFMLEEVVGEAANLLEAMPEDSKVFITSGDIQNLMQMKMDFEDYIITDVVFMTPQEILKGHLRGLCGSLLVCDTGMLPDNIRHVIWQESEILKDGTSWIYG